jgi:hypothetical protein
MTGLEQYLQLLNPSQGLERLTFMLKLQHDDTEFVLQNPEIWDRVDKFFSQEHLKDLEMRFFFVTEDAVERAKVETSITSALVRVHQTNRLVFLRELGTLDI